MKRVDLAMSVIFFLVGAWVLWQATKLPTFSLFGPGPEFMPNVAGVLLLILSALLFANTWKNAPPTATSLIPDRRGMTRIAIIVVALLLYTALLEIVGYLVVTFAYCVLMLFGLARYRWYLNLAIATAITLGFFWAFVVLLDVPVPADGAGVHEFFVHSVFGKG